MTDAGAGARAALSSLAQRIASPGTSGSSSAMIPSGLSSDDPHDDRDDLLSGEVEDSGADGGGGKSAAGGGSGKKPKGKGASGGKKGGAKASGGSSVDPDLA